MKLPLFSTIIVLCFQLLGHKSSVHDAWSDWIIENTKENSAAEEVSDGEGDSHNDSD